MAQIIQGMILTPIAYFIIKALINEIKKIGGY